MATFTLFNFSFIIDIIHPAFNSTLRINYESDCFIIFNYQLYFCIKILIWDSADMYSLSTKLNVMTQEKI